MNKTFSLDGSAVRKHASTLMRMRKYDLPVVISQTLNSAAFDVKTNTMPQESDIFVHRTPTFFKANSRVEKVKGLKVSEMKATVGFKPKFSDKSHSVEDLLQQEDGGDIDNRAFIALPQARINNSMNKNVRVKNRLQTLRDKALDPKNSKKQGKESFITTAVAAGVGGYLFNQDHTYLMEITDISRSGGNTKVKVKYLENIKKGRKAHVKATHFMQKASDITASNMEEMFIVNAKKRINK